MKAKLIVNGKEIEIDISEEEIEKLKVKPTGFERVKLNEIYYCVSLTTSHSISEQKEGWTSYDNFMKNNANYYSDKKIAEDKARVMKLWQKLDKFAVEHNSGIIDWNIKKERYEIYYDYDLKQLNVDCPTFARNLFNVYFEDEADCWKAIREFENELLWYFTEYKERL